MIMFDPISTCRSKLEFPSAVSAASFGPGSVELGVWPGQRTIGNAFISFVRVSVYCDFQSPVAIGLLLIRGRRRDGDELLRWLPAAAVGFVV